MAAQLPPTDRDLIPAGILQQIPGSTAGVPLLATRSLPGGGQLNHCQLVETPAGRYVLRRRVTRAPRPGADAVQELCCQRAAATAGFAPQVIAASADASWLVMDYIDAPPWELDDLQRRDRLEALGTRLARLHEIEAPAIAEFNPQGVVQAQGELLRARGEMDQVELRRLMARSGQLVEACAVPGRAPVLNHGDLNVANLLGPLPMLVDWEYAQLADPLHDYACLFTYYPQLQARRDWILGPAGLDSDAAWHALQARRALFALLNELWGRTQGALHGNAAGLVGVWPAE